MKRIAILSGSGLSAAAGLSTFRGRHGLWRRHDPLTLATPEAWQRDRALVTEFYNERRQQAWTAEPTAAHRAIARLEPVFDTTIVTQNVDDLHEKAGSRTVLHLHGRLDRVRSSRNPDLTRVLRGAPVSLDEPAPDGGDWRPDVVWFGEMIHHYDDAMNAVARADIVLVVGTSLTVQPAASFLEFAADAAEKVVVNAEPVPVPDGYECIVGEADAVVPERVERWLDQAGRS